MYCKTFFYLVKVIFKSPFRVSQFLSRMSYHRPLPASEYLGAHPHKTDICFSFPDGRQLEASKLLLSMASNNFHNMFSGNWREEQVGDLVINQEHAIG